MLSTKSLRLEATVGDNIRLKANKREEKIVSDTKSPVKTGL
jgi:hypothetical protein